MYCGPSIWPNNDKGLEDLARYIIRACFSQQRMTYLPAKDSLDGQAKVIYSSKDGRTSKTFEALDWLAQLVTHIPNKGEQMVRYYGYYSNVSRWKRKKDELDDVIPCIQEPELTDRAFRHNWARLIQKIYEVDPLVCPKCTGPMRVIAFIEQAEVIRKILQHLGLWCARRKPLPRANAPPVPYVAEDVEGWLPTVDDDMIDPTYPVDAYS